MIYQKAHFYAGTSLVKIFKTKLYMKKLLIIFLFTIAINTSYSQINRYEVVQKNTMNGTKKGILDTETKRQIIPSSYDEIEELGSFQFSVINDGKVGIVDTTNKIIIPIIYQKLLQGEDRIFVYNGKKWAIMDLKGKAITQFLYDDILGYSEGVVRIVNYNKIGYVNKSGGVILPCTFEEGYDCYGDFILIYGTTWTNLGFDVVTNDILGNEIKRERVGISGKMPALYNKKGVLIYKGSSGETIKFPPGNKIVVCEKYFAGNNRSFHKILNANGKVLIPYENEYSLSINDDYILNTIAKQNWQYGIINFDGVEILKPNFKSISEFRFNERKLAKVSFFNEEFFYIDKNLKCVEFDDSTCPE